MPTRVETAIARGLAKIKDLAGVPITYTRGNNSIDIDQAIRGRSPATIEDSNGQRVRVFRRDYKIDAVDLDFGAGPVDPASGDEITDGTDTYEVTPLGSGEHPWHWSDGGRTRYRIHVVEK